MPIAALFSGTLWLGNAAYLYLSVAFIQMFKVCLCMHHTGWACCMTRDQTWPSANLYI